MEKSAVVALRDALYIENKNKSVKIAFDNGINLVLSSDMVLWDDEKEIVVAFVADSDSGSFEAGKPIRIICSTYENIQFIMANTNVDNLDTFFDTLSNVINIDDEKKKVIKDYYTKIYDYRRDLSHKNYNPIDIIRD